ncbi:hypothetical protein QQZ08_010850 [Neonectria magnoliae]|uniref:Uncharacterized protein n=1 Tax=Neonectria magnoliae TaxID=2732573 RepID=A0ABR1HEY0_9HYPO
MTQLRGYHSEDMADMADVAGCDKTTATKLEAMLENAVEWQARNREKIKALQREMEVDARVTEFLNKPTFARTVAFRAFACVMEDPLLPIEMLSHWGDEFAEKLKTGIDLRQGPAISSGSQLTLQEDMRDTIELNKLRDEVFDLKSQLVSTKTVLDDRRAEVASLNKAFADQASELFRAKLDRDQTERRKEDYKSSSKKHWEDAIALRQELQQEQERAARVPGLEACIKSLKAALNDEQQLKAKSNAELSVELEESLEKLQAKTRKVRQLQHDSKLSEEKVADLSAQLSNATSQLADRDAQIAHLEGQNQELVTDHNILQSDCNARVQEVVSLQERVRAANHKAHSSNVKTCNTYVKYEAEVAARENAEGRNADMERRLELARQSAMSEASACTTVKEELTQRETATKEKARNRELSLAALFNSVVGADASHSEWSTLIRTLEDDVNPFVDESPPSRSREENFRMWSFSNEACLDLFARLSTNTLGSGLDAAGRIQTTINSVASCDRIHRGLCQSLLRASVSAVADIQVPLNIAVAVRGQEASLVLVMELEAALLVGFQDRQMRWISIDRVDSENVVTDLYVRIKAPSGELDLEFSPSDEARLALLGL